MFRLVTGHWWPYNLLIVLVQWGQYVTYIKQIGIEYIKLMENFKWKVAFFGTSNILDYTIVILLHSWTRTLSQCAVIIMAPQRKIFFLFKERKHRVHKAFIFSFVDSAASISFTIDILHTVFGKQYFSSILHYKKLCISYFISAYSSRFTYQKLTHIHPSIYMYVCEYVIYYLLNPSTEQRKSFNT